MPCLLVNNYYFFIIVNKWFMKKIQVFPIIPQGISIELISLKINQHKLIFSCLLYSWEKKWRPICLALNLLKLQIHVKNGLTWELEWQCDYSRVVFKICYMTQATENTLKTPKYLIAFYRTFETLKIMCSNCVLTWFLTVLSQLKL